MTGTAIASNIRWSRASGLIALAFVAFIIGVTLGVAGF